VLELGMGLFTDTVIGDVSLDAATAILQVAKLALPMTRLSIMRPATATSIFSASSASLSLPACFS
jgi:hypothetical protein